MLALVTALAAFSGAIVAVLIDGILDLYRADVEEAEDIRRTLRLARAIRAGSLSETRKEQNAREVLEDLEEIYIKKKYLLTDVGEDRIKNTLEKLDEDIDDSPGGLSAGTPDFSSLVEVIDEWITVEDRLETIVVTEVTIRGAAKRYFGGRSPYSSRIKPEKRYDWTQLTDTEETESD